MTNEEFKKAVDAIEEKVNKLQADLQSVDQKLSEIGNDIDNLESDILSLQR